MQCKGKQIKSNTKGYINNKAFLSIMEEELVVYFYIHELDREIVEQAGITCSNAYKGQADGV